MRKPALILTILLIITFLSIFSFAMPHTAYSALFEATSVGTSGFSLQTVAVIPTRTPGTSLSAPSNYQELLHEGLQFGECLG